MLHHHITEQINKKKNNSKNDKKISITPDYVK